jgi:hypothetical protein
MVGQVINCTYEKRFDLLTLLKKIELNRFDSALKEVTVSYREF